MNGLPELQQEFLAGLLQESATAIVDRLESTSTHSSAERMGIYRNAYRMRLEEALAIDFERLHGYLGDDLFNKLCNRYIDRYPSHYSSLRHFGSHMIEALSTMEPFREHPEIAEIACIEQAFTDCFDAADARPVDRRQLETLQPADWANLALRFHPSLQLLRQNYNSFAIWHALANDECPPPATPITSTWLIWRQELVSRYRSLDAAESAALDIAQSGGNFADLCATLLAYLDEQETPSRAIGYLQQWIHDGMITGLDSASLA